MPRFVSLIRFTEQGAKEMQKSPARAKAFADAAARAGVGIEGQFWTLGGYDGVLILSGQDEKSVLQLLAGLAAGGNVRTETMPAFDAREFAALVK